MRVLIILIANLLSLTIWCQLGANYGNPSSNEEGYFIKVDDNFIYTVSATYLNGTEFHTMTKFDKTNYSILWQKRFGVSLRINDGVFIGNDNNPSQMYLVGHTLPENINNNSVLLKIDLTNGSIICSQVYNHYGSERFNKIIRHHNPLNVNFPYYILGVHTVDNNSNAAIGKMFLWNISEDCSNPNFVNFTKEYNHVNDDEFHRGLVALNDKTILLTGNRVEGGYGMVVKVTGNGDVISSRSMSIDMEIDEGWPYAFANEGISDGNIMLIASKDMPSSVRTNRNGAPPKQGFLTFVLDAESYLSTSIPEGTTLELKGISSSGQRVLLSNIDVAGIRKGWYGTIKREISIPEKIYSVVLMLKTTSIEPVFLRIDNFCLYSTVGTNDNQNATNFTIYPNPTTGQLTIQFESTLEQDISLKVFDILGKQVNSGIIQKGNSNYSFTIDHMAGIYIIQLTDSDGKASQRKVIKIE